jgi:hypothetical protein
MVFEGKGFQQGIKDLRRDIGEGGLAWVHATESAGKYLQTIVSIVLEPGTKTLVLTYNQLPDVSNVASEQRWVQEQSPH